MTIAITRPNGIAIFQLKAAMSAIRLEQKGLRHSSGKSIKAHWARSLGLGARAKADVVLAKMQEMVEDIEKKGDLGIEEIK